MDFSGGNGLLQYYCTRLFQSQGAPAARRSISLSVIQGLAVQRSVLTVGSLIYVSSIPRTVLTLLFSDAAQKMVWVPQCKGTVRLGMKYVRIT